MTILVVDDSETLRQLTVVAMRHREHITVLEARTGAEGLALAWKFQPALVMLDGGLPDVKGIDILSALRANPATATTPVVFVTGSSELHDDSLAAGATEFVVKPMGLQTLFDLVDRFAPNGASPARTPVPAGSRRRG